MKQNKYAYVTQRGALIPNMVLVFSYDVCEESIPDKKFGCSFYYKIGAVNDEMHISPKNLFNFGLAANYSATHSFSANVKW